LGEQLVVVDDDPVVDPDDRTVPHRMVVGRDRRMALRVVADVDEELARMCRHGDPVEQPARGRALLRAHRIFVLPAAIRVADRVGATIGDTGEQCLRSERPVDAASRREAISSDAAHSS
jgi:hypothetical protein